MESQMPHAAANDGRFGERIRHKSYAPSQGFADLGNAGPRYASAVTQPAAGLRRAPELLTAKYFVLSGHPLPKAVTRNAEPSEIDGAFRELDQVVAPFMEGLRRAGARHRGVQEQITAIIKKASIQTTLTRFEDPVAMAVFNERLRETVSRGAPVVMAMPEGGGKTPVPFKTGYFGGGPDFTEFLGIRMRAALVQVIREFYSGGAHMVIVPDSYLHVDVMGFCPVEADRHVKQIWCDMMRMGLRDEVIMADTSRYMPPNWDEVVAQGAEEVRSALQHDSVVMAAAAAQCASLLFVKRMEHKTEEQALLLYAALAGFIEGIPSETLAAANAFQQETEQMTPTYMAINHHGIRGLSLIERVLDGLGFSSETYLRCSVHAKPGNPRPALSIANSAAPAGLLPMHSLGVRVRGAPQPAWGRTFDIVARMNGWQAVHERTTGRFMYYELAAAAANPPA